MTKGFTIGTLARAAGVNVETIRFYERKGLLHRPPKPEDGYRKYPAEAVKQVRFIKGAQRLGFSLKEIAELLFLGREGEISCSEMLNIASRKIAQIEVKMMELRSHESPRSWNWLGVVPEREILPSVPFGSGWPT